MQGITYTYHTIGETEKAVEWANKLPNIDCTKEMVLERILDGDEKIAQLELNVIRYSGALEWSQKTLENLTKK